MEKLIKKIATIRPMKRCTLACYIVYTIRNTSIDFLRAQKRRIEYTVDLDTDEIFEPMEGKMSMDELIISAEWVYRLWEVWPNLPEEDQILLERKYILGYADAELAFEFKCKPSSIRMKLTRARRRAFQCLAAKEEV